MAKTARNPGADPLLGQLRNEVKHARTELSNRRRALRPTIAKELRSLSQEKSVDSTSSLRHQIEVLQDLEKRIEGERQQLVVGAQTVNSKTLDLQSIQDDIEQSQVAASKMGTEIQSLEVELMAPGRVLKIEDAEVPTTSDVAKRYMMICMATLGAFLASLLGLTFWELQTRKVSDSTEIVGDLGIRLIGTLPVIPVRHKSANVQRSRIREAQIERLMHESIDMTRTMLLNSTKSQTGRVFTITSAMSGEGKTSLSCHLASSLARSGRKTVLIDADMRHPSINQLFDQPLVPGLCEILRGEASFEGAIVPSSIPDLDLIPAGEVDGLAMRSLSLGGIAPLFDQLKPRYDCVVVDTAPVLPVTDTLLIAPYTDGVILAVLTDVSRSNKITDAHQKLIAIGVKILGAVFTGDRPSNYGKDYRYRDLRNFISEPSEEPGEPQPESSEAGAPMA